MNKIGRRQLATKAVMTAATRQILTDERTSALIDERMDRDMAERVTRGRWIAWSPAGPLERAASDDPGDYFIRNLVALQARQPWIWRFIGRRRR